MLVNQKNLKPPTNYTGSKDKLMNQLVEHFPSKESVNLFYDVFAGGLSVSINSPYDRIIANDIITPLIQFYQNLKDNDIEQEVQKILSHKIDKTSAQEFANLRVKFNQTKDPYLFFSLVSSCTNNLMRFNKKFDFNQTFGKRAINDNTIQKVRDYSEVLKSKDIQFTNLTFTELFKLRQPTVDDFVYMDPPYIGTEAGYNAFWSKDLEASLYNTLDELNNRGVRFAFSGVSIHKGVKNPHLDKLSKYKIIELEYDYEKVARKKNAGESQEILVINY
jgi:DNA adenine methylase Dam